MLVSSAKHEHSPQEQYQQPQGNQEKQLEPGAEIRANCDLVDYIKDHRQEQTAMVHSTQSSANGITVGNGPIPVRQHLQDRYYKESDGRHQLHDVPCR